MVPALQVLNHWLGAEGRELFPWRGRHSWLVAVLPKASGEGHNHYPSRRARASHQAGRDTDLQAHCPAIPGIVAQLARSLRVGRTSAQQAGVLDTITKEQSGGSRSSQEKGSSDPWKDKGFAQNKTDPVK